MATAVFKVQDKDTSLFVPINTFMIFPCSQTFHKYPAWQKLIRFLSLYFCIFQDVTKIKSYSMLSFEIAFHSD